MGVKQNALPEAIGTTVKLYTAEPTLARFHRSDKFLRYIAGPFGCLPARTEFLTETGWKAIGEYAPGDKVAQWEPEGGTNTFVEPTDYIKEPCSEFIRFSNGHRLLMEVTPEHRMPLYQFDGKFVIRTAEQIVSKPSRYTVPTTFKPTTEGMPYTDDQLRLMVAICADGNYPSDNPNSGAKKEYCRVVVRKERKKARLRMLLDACDVEYSETEASNRDTETAYTFYFRELAGKHYSAEWWKASRRQLAIILAEVVLWDGHNSQDRLMYCSRHEGDADFIQYCAHSCGLHGWKGQDAPLKDHWNTTYRVDVSRPGSAKGKVMLRGDNLEIAKVESVDGFKYCFSVPSTFFIVRHEGRIFITGNSGKSSGCIMEILMRAMRQQPDNAGVRKSRWAIIRNTYPELKSTTIKTFQQWIPDNIAPVVYSIPITSKFRQKMNDGTWVDLEFVFMALDNAEDVAKLLSLELTGAYLNEGREITWEILEGLLGRIDRYPQTTKDAEGGKIYGPTEPGILVDSNPPQNTHWLYTKFETGDTPPGWEKFQQPPAVFFNDETKKWELNPDAENLSHLPDRYYQQQIDAAEEDFIRVNLGGHFGATRKGKPVFSKFAEHKHVAKEKLNPIRGYTVIVGQDFGLCYSDDMEVLTETGWKLFKDVDEKQDRVATLNPDGFRLEYTDINFKTEFDYDGRMIWFKGQNFDFTVTPEHVTPYTDRDTPHTLKFASADELARATRSHKYMQLRANWEGKPMGMFGLPDDLFAGFMGWYISEGSIDNPERSPNHYCVQIGQLKEAPALDKLLFDPRWPTYIKWRRIDNGWRATVPADLGKYLKQLGKAHGKYIPQEIKEASVQHIKIFISAFVRGDGHVRSKKKIGSGKGRKATDEVTMATVSKRLADELQELCLKMGFSSSIRRQKAQVSTMRDGRKIASDGVYIVAVKKIERAEINANHIADGHYIGKIYCLNVPYHTLYVRRNGKPCWNGNTPAIVLMQLTEHGVRITDELPATDETLEDFLDEYLSPLLLQRYQGFSVVACGDPAGKGRSAHDKRTSFDILRSRNIKAFPAFTNDPVLRIGTVNWFLGRDGGFEISPHCTHLREAMGTGYVFKESKNSKGEILSIPLKNQFSHIADATQYACLYARYGNRQLNVSKKDPSLAKPHLFA